MRILQVNSARSLGGGETHVLQLTRALRGRGHEVFLAGRRGGPLNPDIPLTPLKLRSILKHEDIDIVHAHAARDYPLVAAAALGIRGVKVIFTRHLLYPVRRSILYKRVDGWIAPTAEILETLKPLKPKRSVVIPNWVDTQKFAYRPHPSHKPVRIGLIGQISPHKGHDDAVEAMRELGGEFQLIIAGEGEASYIKKLKRQSSGLPVAFAGFVTLPDYFAAIDILIVPSWQEPFGIVTLEAMSAGVPVVGTGPADVLRGTFIPPRNSHALAHAIRTCKLDAEAREHVERNFDVRKVIPKIEEFYAGIIRSR
ncbi:MAG TPA: glycosyltransferase family 4 protein [Terriglobia bacterium]|jgi:glycosyltransferase involved in cell wall biosynthesis